VCENRPYVRLEKGLHRRSSFGARPCRIRHSVRCNNKDKQNTAGLVADTLQPPLTPWTNPWISRPCTRRVETRTCCAALSNLNKKGQGGAMRSVQPNFLTGHLFGDMAGCQAQRGRVARFAIIGNHADPGARWVGTPGPVGRYELRTRGTIRGYRPRKIGDTGPEKAWDNGGRYRT